MKQRLATGALTITHSIARAVALSVTLFWVVSGIAFGQPSSEKVSRTVFLFGTPCTVSIYGKPSDADFTEVFSRMEELDGLLSTYIESSAVSALNRGAGGGPMAVPFEVYEVVRHGIAYSQLSGGAFDITIGPLIQLWGVTGDTPRVPSESEISAALEFVDFRRIVLLESGKRILLEGQGMLLDLGGIAKGYAADEAAKILREQGHSQGLINFGGNIVAIGSRPDGTPWRIGIQHPEESRGDTIAIVEVADRTVVTTGKYERFFLHNDVRYHHIIDTKTGYPVENGLASVTIITDSSMKADALSTAVFTLGLTAGLELIRSFDGVEAVLVTEEGVIHVTEGIAEAFTLVDTRFSVVR